MRNINNNTSVRLTLTSLFKRGDVVVEQGFNEITLSTNNKTNLWFFATAEQVCWYGLDSVLAEAYIVKEAGQPSYEHDSRSRLVEKGYAEGVTREKEEVASYLVLDPTPLSEEEKAAWLKAGREAFLLTLATAKLEEYYMYSSQY